MADRSVVVRLKADVQGFRSSMASAKRSVDDLTKADVNKPAKSFDSLATKAAFAGGAIALGIGKAISSFAEFDATMSAAAAATGSTGDQLQALRDAAVKAGADTQFSATEAAQGITEMAKAGVSAKDILGGGLTGALDLAAAGQLAVGDAAEIAATAVNQFNLKGQDVAHVADLYSAAAGKAQGSVTDIAGAMKYAGVTAASMGVSIEETTGTIGLFASKGIIGEQAGTSFRSMLMSMTAPSKAAAATMEDLGINVYDAQGKFVGMQGAAEILKKKLGPLDEATRNQALGQIFGNESMGAAITLYQAGGKGVADWTAKVNDAGFAQEQAAKLTDNLQGDIERLGGSLETAFIQTGSGANDALRALTKGLGNLVNVVADVPAPILLATGGLASLALLVPKGISAFRNYTQQLDDIGLSMDNIASKSPRAAAGLKALAAAGTVAAIAGLSNELRDLIATAQVSTPETDKLASSLTAIADGAKESGSFAELFARGMGPFANNFETASAAMDDFGANAKAALDPEPYEVFFGTAGGASAAFTKRVQEIDQALVQMVQSGHGEQAAQIVDQLAQSTVQFGGSADQVRGQFTGYAAAVQAAGTASATAGPQIGGMSADVQDIEKSADDAKKALDDLTATIEGFGSPAAEARAAARGFQQAIDDASDAVKKNGRTLNDHTAKGRANAAALDTIREATLKNVTSTFKLTGSAGKATAAMKAGRDAFIRAAVAAGSSRTAANKLADQLGLIPKDVNTQIALSGVPQAKAKASGVQGQLDKLGRTRPKPTVSVGVNGATAAAAEARLNTIARNRRSTITTTVVTRNVTTGVGVSGATKNVNRAGGGPVYGPGSSVSDSIAARLSNGEFVMKTAAVDKYGLQFMHEVNAMRLAGGGLASRAAVAPSAPGHGSGVDYARLAREFARAMPPNISVYSGADAASAARTALRRWEWDQVSRL